MMAVVLTLSALASFQALREFLTLAHTRRADHWALFAAFFVVVPVQHWLIAIEWYGLYSVFIPVYAFLLLPILSVFRGDPKSYLDRVAELQWALMTCVYCLSHVPALLNMPLLDAGTSPVMLVVFLACCVYGAAIAERAGDAVIGRRLLAPGLAPSLTMEGLLSGVLAASAIGALLSDTVPFGISGSAALAATVALLGGFGRLVLAAIKRDRGVEQWGGAPDRPGMLGLLGRMLYAAPIFFHLVRYFYGA
ncbi:MAG: phosphatidate cytidylyltransferase [Phycisphaerae bacterium]